VKKGVMWGPAFFADEAPVQAASGRVGDFTILSGDTLLEFSSALSGTIEANSDTMVTLGLAPQVATLLVLTLDGVSKVLGRTHLPNSRYLRTRWSEVRAALESGKDLPTLSYDMVVARPGGKKSTVEVVRSPEPDARDQFDVLRRFSLACREQVQLGNLDLASAKSLVLKAFTGAASTLWPTAIVPHEDIPTAVTVSAPEVGLAAPESAHIEVALLKGTPVPEKFRGWATCQDIARRLNQHENSVKHYMSVIFDEEPTIGPDREIRANVLAGEALGSDLEALRNAVDPETGIATFINEETTCAALFVQDSKGQFFWRNYWNPQFVAWLTPKLQEKYRSRSARPVRVVRKTN
jgi:hypothetical protein